MARKRINFVEEATGVKVDDPAVLRAMKVYGHLDEVERSNTYRSSIQAMIAYRRTGEVRHLTELARSYEEMIRIDAIPGLREKIRAQRDAPLPEPAGEADIERLLARLRGGDGDEPR